MQKHNHVELQVEQQYQQHLQVSTTNEKVKKAQCMECGWLPPSFSLTKHIQHLIQFYSFWGSVWALCNDTPAFSRAQQFKAVVSDILKFVQVFQQFAMGMTKMTFVSTSYCMSLSVATNKTCTQELPTCRLTEWWRREGSACTSTKKKMNY